MAHRAGAGAGARGETGSGLSFIDSIRAYVDRMMTEVPGMKALLLDKETVGIVSVAYSQSEMLEKEVLIAEPLARDHERMTHMNAICFMRPTSENVYQLRKELKDPKFNRYHVYFSNSVSQQLLQQLADADTGERVASVQAYFADYVAVNPDTMSLNLANALSLSVPRDRWGEAQEKIFSRTCDGVVSLMLSMQRKAIVRYAGASQLAGFVANEVAARMDRDRSLFDFRRNGTPLVVILDRRDDPVTPLLAQWTYQAMVHELLTLSNNCVDLTGVKGVDRKQALSVLSPRDDAFFRKNMYANFGDLGAAVGELLSSHAQREREMRQIESIDDMRRVASALPDFNRQAGGVAKHVTILSELSRQVDEESLMSVSEVEQEMACGSDHGRHASDVERLIGSAAINDTIALRLVVLYALRHEGAAGSRLDRFRTMLRGRGLPQASIAVIDTALQYGGVAARGNDLFSSRSFAARMAARVTRGMQGVENVYTQHKPYLAEVVDNAFAKRLSEAQFPHAAGASREAPREVFVFVVGGITFEEAAYVARFNEENKGKKSVLLGGTFIHNSKSFLDELSRMAGGRGV